jgi:cytochrome P450
VTKYNDIMHVDTSHHLFSSDVSLGGISIRDVPPGYDWPSFIAMDQPRHAAQRKTVSPMFTPAHLDELAILIRERAGKVLDALPRGETFNFVDRVSIELTTQMLATLFDFPGRAPQTDALVRCLDRAAQKHDRRIRRAAPRRNGRVRGLLHKTLERARQRAAAQRPAVDDGA